MSEMKVNDKVWRSIRAKLKAMGASGAHVRVGVMGNDETDTGVSMVELASIHEFGSPAAGIPERSFIRSTFERVGDQADKFTLRLARAVISERSSVSQALGLLGAWGADQVRRSIVERLIKQDLKPATIARKGSDTALVDTGRLLGAISWEVVE